MSIREKIDEEFEELAEEEFSVKSRIKGRTYDAAKRRIDKDNVAKVAILVSFVGTIFVAMAVSYLNEQKILTVEGALLIIGGGLLYVSFRMFVLIYNYLFAKLQRVAIELDIKEAKVRRAEAETDAYEAREAAKVEENKLLFTREQNRHDMKLKQDLHLRAPFFQEAQKNMMNFFARDDIVAALQVPPTFVESVERLDDILLKRASMDLTVEKITNRLNDVMVTYSDISRQTKENAEILNQLIQQDAERTVKWQQTEVGLNQVQNQIHSLGKSMETLMEIMTAGMPAKISETPEQKEKFVEEESITKDLEELLDKSTKVAAFTPTDDGTPIHTNTSATDGNSKDEEEDDLPPPPPSN